MDPRLKFHDKLVNSDVVVEGRRRLRSALSLVDLPQLDTSSSTRFVIFGLGRTGSTLLVELLDQNSGVVCDGELLHRWQPLPLRYVAARVRQRDTGRAYGFKLLSYQLRLIQGYRDAGFFVDWLQNHDFRILYLRRTDVLRHAISQVNARVNTFHHRGEGAARQRITVPPDELFWWIERIEERRALDDALMEGRHRLDVEYETDLATESRQARLVERLTEFLELDLSYEPSTLKKVSPNALDELVANADELRRALAGTDYAAFADR